ncbi:MAG: hypothetical protein JKY56_07920 [Kofleriaceae bacterium]|nr:hypothetical protein [Kofleriaceae bacterium]
MQKRGKQEMVRRFIAANYPVTGLDDIPMDVVTKRWSKGPIRRRCQHPELHNIVFCRIADPPDNALLSVDNAQTYLQNIYEKLKDLKQDDLFGECYPHYTEAGINVLALKTFYLLPRDEYAAQGRQPYGTSARPCIVLAKCFSVPYCSDVDSRFTDVVFQSSSPKGHSSDCAIGGEFLCGMSSALQGWEPLTERTPPMNLKKLLIPIALSAIAIPSAQASDSKVYDGLSCHRSGTSTSNVYRTHSVTGSSGFCNNSSSSTIYAYCPVIKDNVGSTGTYYLQAYLNTSSAFSAANRSKCGLHSYSKWKTSWSWSGFATAAHASSPADITTLYESVSGFNTGHLSMYCKLIPTTPWSGTTGRECIGGYRIQEP